MDIILLKDVEKVGEIHEVVNVKPGFARNYLIPQGLAITANAANMSKLDKLDELKAKQEAAAQQYIDAANVEAAKMEGKVLKIGTKAGTSGKIFGSVTNVQLIAALKDQLGVVVERKAVEIVEEVKELGTYMAKVTLHKQVVKEIAFEVIQED